LHYYYGVYTPAFVILRVDDISERKKTNHRADSGKKMKPIILNKYSTAAILLFAAAAVFIDIALISNPGDITTAAFVLSGMVCAMTGIFTLTFSAGEPVDPRLLGILPAQGSINLSRITHHLGKHGHAYFLPRRVTGETKVMQFNPTTIYDGKQGSEKGSFREKGPEGLVITPSCDLLIQDLTKRNALLIPNNEENLTQLLQETIEDIFKFAPRVTARWFGNSVTITFHDYPAIDGCKVIAQESPDCCAMSPCPMCSLCGVLIAEGKDKVVTLDQCTISSSSRNVIAVFSLVPGPDGNR
jgi:hypothetical protein